MKARSVLVPALAVLVLGGLLVWALRPEPVSVDMAEARVAPMQGIVAAEGVTRVREPYLVTAPFAGMVQRAPVAVGDAVVRAETVVALIRPADPALLDARARAQAEAAVAEAEAALEVARANLNRVLTDLGHAERRLIDNMALAASGTIPRRALEDSQQAAETARAAGAAARSELAMRQATLAVARAQLMGPAAQTGNGNGATPILAPQSGTVLGIETESARLVQAGEPLLSIGDLSDLEIEVDLLSSDAVALSPGARAEIDRWGGAAPLPARVRRIDPRGFTRVSALGIEEQRVRVLLDLDAPPEARPGLGDAFRVFARIVTWEAEGVLQIPVSALFRRGEGWAVYRVEGDTAALRMVETGRMSRSMAEVTSGLAPGDLVVTYPGERVTEGTRLTRRVLP